MSLAIVLIAVISATWYFHTRTAQEMDPIASSGGSDSLSIRIEHVPYWLQNDPRWGAETIGGSNERMAAAGCTITCLAMSISYLGYQTDPQQLCRDLKHQDGFTDQGYIKWDAVKVVTSGKLRVEFPNLTHEAIEAALHEKKPVIAKIMLSAKVPHWVLIIGKEESEFIIIDPLNPERKLLRLSDRSAQIYALRVVRAV